MTARVNPTLIEARDFNPRLYGQYSAMLLMAWMGMEFADDALIRWNRLRMLYAN